MTELRAATAVAKPCTERQAGRCQEFTEWWMQHPAEQGS
jgi:hypothetical protein